MKSTVIISVKKTILFSKVYLIKTELKQIINSNLYQKIKILSKKRIKKILEHNGENYNIVAIIL